MLSDAGLVVERSYYFNYLLFVPILLARAVLRLLRPAVSSENEINFPLMNRALRAIFAFDVATAPLLRPPFGVSALVLASKPAQGGKVETDLSVRKSGNVRTHIQFPGKLNVV